MILKTFLEPFLNTTHIKVLQYDFNRNIDFVEFDGIASNLRTSGNEKLLDSDVLCFEIEDEILIIQVEWVPEEYRR